MARPKKASTDEKATGREPGTVGSELVPEGVDRGAVSTARECQWARWQNRRGSGFGQCTGSPVTGNTEFLALSVLRRDDGVGADDSPKYKIDRLFGPSGPGNVEIRFGKKRVRNGRLQSYSTLS